MKKNIFLLIFASVVLVCCSKQSAYEKDIVKPTLKVIYPLDKPTINNGDPLCIKLLISDNKSLAGVWLQVNDGQGFKKEYAIPGRSMEIIEKYYIPAGVKGQFTAKFFAADEAGNTGTAEILFSSGN